MVLCKELGFNLAKLYMQHIYLGRMNLWFIFVVYDTCFTWLCCFNSELQVLKSRALPVSTLLHIDLPTGVSGYKAVSLRLWAKE